MYIFGETWCGWACRSGPRFHFGPNIRMDKLTLRLNYFPIPLESKWADLDRIMKTRST